MNDKIVFVQVSSYKERDFVYILLFTSRDTRVAGRSELSWLIAAIGAKRIFPHGGL